MKKTFAGRRIPRKIVQDDADPQIDAATIESTLQSAVKRPVIKHKKSGTPRASFLGSADDEGDEGDGDRPVHVASKRLGLSRVAVQRNALKRSSLLAADSIARHADDDEDRASYSAASLQALKESTPSTPRENLSADVSGSEIDNVSTGTQQLDLSSKFGSSLARYQQSTAIPSAAEIAEKKARRARLAQEHAADEYISLDPDDPGLDDDGEELDPNVERDERGRLVLKPKDKYKESESRLVREDEDIMENFDEFTEADSRIALSRRAQAEVAQERKANIAAQIEEAESRGFNDEQDESDSDASERERNALFEASQTRHGLYGTTAPTRGDDDSRPRTPPRIAPLPTLDGAVAKLRARVAEMQAERTRQVAEMEALRREKVRLAEEEVRIQAALRETAEKFSQLRAASGIASDGADVAGTSTRAEALSMVALAGRDGGDGS